VFGPHPFEPLPTGTLITVSLIFCSSVAAQRRRFSVLYRARSAREIFFGPSSAAPSRRGVAKGGAGRRRDGAAIGGQKRSGEQAVSRTGLADDGKAAILAVPVQAGGAA